MASLHWSFEQLCLYGRQNRILQEEGSWYNVYSWNIQRQISSEIFHCVFNLDNDQVESRNFWPEIFYFCLRQKTRDWRAFFDTWLSNVKSVSGRVKVCLQNARSVCNKTSQKRNLIEANDFNRIVLTETWIKHISNDEFFLHQCCPCPNDYYYMSANRKERKGGGLAVFYDGTVWVDNFSSKCLTNAELASLEFKLGNSV